MLRKQARTYSTSLSDIVKPWGTRLASLRGDDGIHWRAPAIMVVSLFSGIMVSLFHHLFNSFLDGRSAGSATEQQWVRRLETAFAFMSRLFLAASTTVAYSQYLWLYLQQKPSRLSSIDTMVAATNNTLRFVNVGFWRGRPMLAFLAFVIWCLPLSAVFTPGTLTVQSQLHTSYTMITIPDRQYRDIPFYATTVPRNGSSLYKGMTVETTRNVGRVQLANALLSVPRPDTNVSYSTHFFGPALSCSPAEDEILESVGHALQNLTNSSFAYHGYSFSNSQIVYCGWVPQVGASNVNTSFFEDLIIQGNGLSSDNLDYVSSDAARIYVYLNTSGLTQGENADGQMERVPTMTQTSDALITCAMYNASYQMHFDVRTTGEQNVTASTTFLNWQATQAQISDDMSSLEIGNAFSPQALMEAFGWTFTQFFYVLPPSNGSTTIYGTHTLQMNSALLPVQPGLDPSDSAEYMMHQMEDFFKNMTVGLRYGELPEHTGDSDTSMTAVNATSRWFRSDYVYEPEALIIAYFISNTMSLLCIGIGTFAIYKNGACFTNNFSTIVRVTNHLDFEDLIDEARDRSGADPLPKHIGDTVISLGQQRQQIQQQDVPVLPELNIGVKMDFRHTDMP